MKIEIMEYNPDWTKNFEEEKIKLLHFFGSHAVAIEHIGSTAIPNQRAKPVIAVFYTHRRAHDTVLDTI
ncbi:GrpB family protein [Escherichia coli]|nr:GrpB family protein [Escherichia coli]